MTNAEQYAEVEALIQKLFDVSLPVVDRWIAARVARRLVNEYVAGLDKQAETGLI